MRTATSNALQTVVRISLKALSTKALYSLVVLFFPLKMQRDNIILHVMCDSEVTARKIDNS